MNADDMCEAVRRLLAKPGYRSHRCRRGRVWWKRAPRFVNVQVSPPPGVGWSILRVDTRPGRIAPAAVTVECSREVEVRFDEGPGF